jgi:hypothetical protein
LLPSNFWHLFWSVASGGGRCAGAELASVLIGPVVRAVQVATGGLLAIDIGQEACATTRNVLAAEAERLLEGKAVRTL